MMEWRRGKAGLILILAIVVLLTACSERNANHLPTKETNTPTKEAPEASQQAGELPAVELTWYYPQWSIQPETASVEAEINKITTAAINATIKLMPVDGGSYESKLQTMVAASEKFDMAWTSFWMFNYAQNARRGAFIQIDEWLQSSASELYASMPGQVWDALKVDGKTYAILNYQTITNKEGFLIQKRFADKYQLDVNTIKTVKDMEPFLRKIKENEPDIIPFALTRNGNFENMKTTYNQLEFISNEALAGIYRTDSDIKVVDMVKTPEYREYLDLMHSWYKDGLINKDAPVVKALDERKKTGQIAVSFENVLKPGKEAEEKNASGGQDIVLAPTSDPFVGTNTIIQSMQAISQTSLNPERAMMFLNLLNTNPELLNLVSYGIEGKHYEKVADNIIKPLEEGGYNPNQTWVFGNGFIAYLQEGQDPETQSLTLQENKQAQSSPILGFTFDPEPVQTEIANLQTVNDEYGPRLNTGSVSADEKLEEYIEKRQRAGIDKVIEEIERQLQAWKLAVAQ
ncbi:ABC transporter substrate-binding protein [Paenibacillus paeoniae]|uniref:Extracellular solute-binding protein n=1 Tax=Paenibacillus paeoniae TaxID=2292705 RepID=A0A371P5T3_9BACL|nr:ABC transporter substrate-binding protein [Paenibacillus paeoniae]REK71323.1 extracellular solute-binding protein [Paenibacillus paeoniae]